MKKTLAIVLALVMVLAMIPAAFAAPTNTVETRDRSYEITIESNTAADGTTLATDPLKKVSNANRVTFEYDTTKLKAVPADQWAADKYMALVTVKGFDTTTATGIVIANPYTITVNGRTLDLTSGQAPFVPNVTEGTSDNATGGSIAFPIELPKTGLNMTYDIVIEQETSASGVTTLKREIIKITLSGANGTIYKDEKSASFTVSSDKGNAYIVGNTVYVDYQDTIAPVDTLTFTFKNDAGALFSETTYLQEVRAKSDQVVWAKDPSGFVRKLDSSKVELPYGNTEHTDVQMKLETKNSVYKLPKFNIVVRKDVAKVDPKGIYFADNVKTIKIGEGYTPVVMGVATNLPVKADILLTSTGVEASLINVIDKKTVYGLSAGTTFITAGYKTVDSSNSYDYEASSMKIVVLNELYQGTTTPPSVVGTQMYVTCRTLNVRAGAGTGYKVAGKLTRNAKVTVLETANGWSKISFNGTTAYVSAKYLAK